MSRKTIYTLIITLFILIFLGLLGGYFYLNQKDSSLNGDASETSSNGDGGFFSGLFSRFRNDDTATSLNESDMASTTAVQADNGTIVVIPRLRQISVAPTAGASFTIRNVASTTIVKGVVKNITIPETFIRYVERATGHIFETKPDSLTVEKISNTTIPRIQEAYFTNGASALLLRYLDNNETTIKTYHATLVAQKIATSTASSSLAIATSSPVAYQLSGAFLPDNIKTLSISPTKDRIFYLQNGSQGALGIIAAPNNSGQRQVLSYPLKEWDANWPTANTIVLTTKPSGGVPGYLFFLNQTAGTLTKVFGNVAGLTALASPDLSSVLYSSNNGSNFNLNLYIPSSGLSSAVPLKTLPEKCVWSQKSTGIVYCAVPIGVNSGSYPDIWYQGAVSFTDNFWKINVKTGVRSLIARPADLAHASVDAINLSLDSSENYLMFTNKKDLTLWDLLVNPPAAPSFSATSTASTTVSR